MSMILPRALLQGCCLSCLWGAVVIWGTVETIGVVCDPRAPWYGTCRSRVSGTHIASGHALLCSRCFYRGVCSGPGIKTVWACSRGSVYTEWVPSTILFVPTADMRVVAVRLGRAEDKVGCGVSSLGRGARRPSAEGLPKWSGACLLQMQW